MPIYFQRPENALKRADELLEVDKKADALEALHDVIKSRRHRTWTKIHEQIMTKHLTLCVDLRKPHIAKDGLFQYRNMCQQVNVKSLETVITAFLKVAEKKADDAKAESAGKVEEDIEDLDVAESPETLMLKAVSGEDSHDRMDRTVLSPWLKFLWESYRQCLELLRNNAQVEQLYHKVAKNAFGFCLKYQRKAEFKKLSDNLRTHLTQLQRIQHTSYSSKLSNVDTLALHQETRLTQLDVAIKMELWQEAFKSIEDLHHFMQLTKRIAKPQVMANYYEKLSMVFWKAGNSLFHAAALYKLFLLYKDQKKSFSAEESTQLASRVLLASLCAWSYDSPLTRHLDMEEQNADNFRRLSGLLGLTAPPSRQGLLNECRKFVDNALPFVRNLYNWMQYEFSPLNLAAKVQSCINEIDEDERPELAQYIDALKRAATLKLLKQISQIYQTITFDRLKKIIPFYDDIELEEVLVGAVKSGETQMCLDHRRNCVIFGGGDEIGIVETGTGSKDRAGDSSMVQATPSEQVRKHLASLYDAVTSSVLSFEEAAHAKKLEDMLSHQVHVYGYHADDNHKRALERKKKIEVYKESTELLRSEQEKKAKEEQETIERQQREEEEQRLKRERDAYEEEQKKLEIENRKKTIMQERIKKLQTTETGRKVISELDQEELETLDTELLLQKQVKQMERERNEQQAKLKQQEKKWDYLVRALHVEETALLDEEYNASKDQERVAWDEYETDRIERLEKEHEKKLEIQARLLQLEEDSEVALEQFMDAQKENFAVRVAAFEKKLDEVRKRRLQERKEERKQKRRQEYEDKKRREAQEKRDEEMSRARRPPGSAGIGGGIGGGRPFEGRRDEPRQDEEESGADQGVWRRGLGGGARPAQPQPSEEKIMSRETMMKPTEAPSGGGGGSGGAYVPPSRRKMQDGVSTGTGGGLPGPRPERPPMDGDGGGPPGGGSWRGGGGGRENIPPPGRMDSEHQGRPEEPSDWRRGNRSQPVEESVQQPPPRAQDEPTPWRGRSAGMRDTPPAQLRESNMDRSNQPQGAWDRGNPPAATREGAFERSGGARERGAWERGGPRESTQPHLPPAEPPKENAWSRGQRPVVEERNVGMPREPLKGVWAQKEPPPADMGPRRGYAEVSGGTANNGPPSQTEEDVEYVEWTWDMYFHYCIKTYDKEPRFEDFRSWFVDSYGKEPPESQRLAAMEPRRGPPAPPPQGGHRGYQSGRGGGGGRMDERKFQDDRRPAYPDRERGNWRSDQGAPPRRPPPQKPQTDSDGFEIVRSKR